MSAHAAAVPVRFLMPALDLLDVARTAAPDLPLRGITIDHHQGNLLLASRGPVRPVVQSWSEGFNVDWEISGQSVAPPGASAAHWHAVEVVRAHAVAFGQLPVVLVLMNTGPDARRGDVHVEVRDQNDVLAWATVLGGYRLTEREYRVDSAINGTRISVSALREAGSMRHAEVR